MLKTNFWTQDQNFVYVWRYSDDTCVKIGKSSVGSFWQSRIRPAITNDYRDVELLGIVPCDSKESAVALENELLQRFERVHPNREWVYFTDDLRLWLKTNSIELPLLEDFKPFQKHLIRHRLDTRIGNHFRHGKEKLDQEDYEGAGEAFEKALDLIDTEPKPNHAKIYLYCGVASYELNLKSETYFLEAIRLNPDLAEAYLYLGKCKYLTSDFDGALDNLNKAIQLNPKLAEVYLERGYVYKEQGDLLAAHVEFSKAISLEEGWKSYFHRGLIDIELNQYECAIEAFDHVIEQKPEHIQAYVQRALAKYALSESQDARADYEKALALAEADGSHGVIYSVKKYAIIFAPASQT